MNYVTEYQLTVLLMRDLMTRVLFVVCREVASQQRER